MSMYCIINSSEVSNLDFSQLKDSGIDFIRYNLNGTKAVVEYDGTLPLFLSGKTEYTHSEISIIINDYDEGWNQQDLY